MRVALCISGHIRHLDKTAKTFKHFNIGSVDVFIHTWDDNAFKYNDRSIKLFRPAVLTSEPVDLSLLHLLKPKSVIVENNANFKLGVNYKPENIYTVIGCARPENIISQLYSITRSYDALKIYEEEHNFKYDVIIRSRFDYLYRASPSKTELTECIDNPNWLFVPHKRRANHGHEVCTICLRGDHEGPHNLEVCDVFAYGGREAMGHYLSMYHHVWPTYFKSVKHCQNHLHHDFFNIVEGMYITHNNSRQNELATFCPERLLMHHLEGYRLRPSRIKGNICR